MYKNSYDDYFLKVENLRKVISCKLFQLAPYILHWYWLCYIVNVVVAAAAVDIATVTVASVMMMMVLMLLLLLLLLLVVVVVVVVVENK